MTFINEYVIVLQDKILGREGVFIMEEKNLIAQELNDLRFIKDTLDCCKVLPLTEGGVSRIFSQLDSPFLMITASRGEYNLQDNRKRNARLVIDFRSHKLGGQPLMGGCIENKGEPNEKTVQEESFFITLNKDSDFSTEQFKQFGIDMMKKYDQDFIVYGVDNIAYEISKTKAEKQLGTTIKMNSDTLNKYYSKAKGRKFVFEGIMSPNSVFHAFALGSLNLF